MAESPLVIGLAGFGTVGGGLLRILEGNREEFLARAGRPVRVKTVLVRDPFKPRACDLPAQARLTTDAADILEDPEINLVVELIGGVDKAGEIVRDALCAGKHVVTANKALLAERGGELFALAEEKGLHLGYEGSVCGGVPVVQCLRESLAGNRMESLVGILNGTSNFILSEMSTRGLDFESALRQAQQRGYAEADPTLDIGGFDAAHKLALLIRLAWGVEYPYTQLPVRGIAGVTAEDIVYAREFGYRIKLIGHARLSGGADGSDLGFGPGPGFGIEAGVCPALVHETLLLARVGGAYNAVRIKGNAAGPVFLHGRGAGDLPTGSAVAADILAVARAASPNNTGFARPQLLSPARIIPPEEASSCYYIRLHVPDRPGVLRDVAAVMAENNISIAQVIQKEQRPRDPSRNGGADEPGVPFIVMTHEAPTAGVRRALETLAASPLVHEPPVHYRVLDNTN